MSVRVRGFRSGCVIPSALRSPILLDSDVKRPIARAPYVPLGGLESLLRCMLCQWVGARWRGWVRWTSISLVRGGVDSPHASVVGGCC
eukprot:539141-Prymnesium_polylepis.2